MFSSVLCEDFLMPFSLSNLLIFSGVEDIARCILILIYVLHPNKIRIIVFHILVYFFTPSIHTLK